jgi:diadenosine tetraphosphate (Ap4A) HIT family hydrolase
MRCVFCADPREAGELVFEDHRTWVLLHASALEEEEWLHVARVWHRVEKVVLEQTKADRAIVMKLGIQTPHLHIHLYPMQAKATRDDVFAAIDGKATEPRDDDFIRTLTAALG